MCKNLCAKFTPYHKDKHDIQDRFHVFSVRKKNRSLIDLSKLSDKASTIYPQTYDSTNKCKSLVQQPCEEASMDQEDFPLSMDDNVQLEPSYNWFCNQISPTLAKELDMDTHYVADKDVSDWHPPTTHGLNNSSRVIPEYYLTGKVLAGNLLEIDFYFTIVDDIRNLRKLSPYQQTFIRSLPDEKKQELLEEYRACVEYIIDNISSGES